MANRSSFVALLGALFLSAGGCSGESTDEPQAGGTGGAGTGGAGAGGAPATGGAGGTDCDYGGQVYADGSSFPAEDGCNQCTCSNGQVACTLMACAPTGGAGGSGGGASDCVGQPCGARACSITVECFAPPCLPVGGWCDDRGECVADQPNCG